MKKKDGFAVGRDAPEDMEGERDMGQLLRETLGQQEHWKITSEVITENMKLLPKDMNLTIGIPNSFGMVNTDFMSSFIGMIQGVPVVRQISWADQGPIHAMRNNLVMGAMEKGATHLLMLDTDMVMPPFLIPALARHNQPVVAALCFKRYPPFSPTLYQGDPGELYVMTQWPKDKLVAVTATGCASILIDLAIFANLEYPWFEYKEDGLGKHIGEDIQFCYRCKEKGIPVFVDTTVECDHTARMKVNTTFFRVMDRVLTLNMEHKAT